MDIKLFQQKLNEICEIAEENGKQLSQQQIREHFDESDLNTSQLVKILQYLKLKGITIEGAEKATGASAPDAANTRDAKQEEFPGTRTALTAEEQAYLRDYMEDLIPKTSLLSSRPLPMATLLPRVNLHSSTWLRQPRWQLN